VKPLKLSEKIVTAKAGLEASEIAEIRSRESVRMSVFVPSQWTR
jgi:hypothetical protein